MNRTPLKKLLLIACLLPSFIIAADKEEETEAKVRVVPVLRTLESNNVYVTMIFPKNFKNYSKLPINTSIRLEGYPLGVISQFERANEIEGTPEGQSIHFFIDDQPYSIYDESVVDSFNENRQFNDKILDIPVDNLTPGEHVFRAVAARSYNECLKGEGAFAAKAFFYKDWRKRKKINVDLSKPYLTYNMPQGDFTGNKPILLDFYLSNCRLSTDGYKVRLSINGDVLSLLARWVPYYLYGLPKGENIVRLELLDKDNKKVPGLFNDTTRKITVK